MKTKIKTENKNFLHIFKKLENFIFCEIKIFTIFFAILEKVIYVNYMLLVSQRYFRHCHSTQKFPYILHIHTPYY